MHEDETTVPSDDSAPLPRRYLRLLVFGAESYLSYPLPEAGALTLGRGAECDVTLSHPSISRHHAILEIRLSDSSGIPELSIQDLGSSIGTIVRGDRLGRNESRGFDIGEIVDLGQTMLIVQRASSDTCHRRLWSQADYEDRLGHECERARASDGRFVVLRVIVDAPAKARPVEDALGRALRSFDLLARYSRHEYELLIFDQPASAVPQWTEPIQRALEERQCSARIGFAAFPEDGTRPQDLVRRAAARARGIEAPSFDDDGEDRPGAIVEDDVMKALFRTIDRVAPTTINVLVLGETGAGKEVVAEQIHRQSRRADRPFLRLNCAALAEMLLENELFGHEPEAFTGAVKGRPGLLESANGGTVLLDEIGELPIHMQAKLLRVIEDKKVLRIGAVEQRPADVRIIAATNRDLEERASRGEFRTDLFYRLGGVVLVVPPLRERIAEIPALARSFAARATKDRPRSPGITSEALELLTTYSWPGNVRELRNVVELAALMAGDDDIRREHLPADKLAPRTGREDPAAPEVRTAFRISAEDPPVLTEAQRQERQRIVDALSECVGNQTRAAELLGMSRRTLSYRLDEYKIPRPRKRR